METKQPETIEEIKTGRLSRRLAIAKASLVVGAKIAGSSAAGLFQDKNTRERQRNKVLEQQAQYLGQEIGRLKGSIVKIGQMLALYGEHFLPTEVTSALHQLNDQSVALSWSVIEPELKKQLGVRFAEFDIDAVPLGTASLAQVHKARIKATGEQVVLKLQYPGVAAAIDSDLDLFKQLLLVTKVVPQTAALEDWFDEIHDMLKREVDYAAEAATTQRFRRYLASDHRFVVPHIHTEFCTPNLIVMSFEGGVPLQTIAIDALSQERRNALADAALEVAMREIAEWGEMQTDPNFGNYLIRLAEDGDNQTGIDQIVLLDFGAFRQFDDHLLALAKRLLAAGAANRVDQMTHAMQGYPFFDNMPIHIRHEMAQVFMLACLPFQQPDSTQSELWTADNRFDWVGSALHDRVMRAAGTAMGSQYFELPPKEFMFLSRKFIGVYTFITVLDAKTKSYDLAQRYLSTVP